MTQGLDRDNPLIQERLKKLKELQGQGIAPYPNGITVSHFIDQIQKGFDALSGEEVEAKTATYQIAGRVMALRSFGKAAFVQLRDRTGRLQVFIDKKSLSQEAFQIFQALDIGDFIHVTGRLFRTKTHELTLRAERLRLVTKSLRPLPEKWHGLTDVEIRYRQRYVDLIANEAVKDVFVKRSQIVHHIRDFFVRRDFLEVETPMMHPIPGGARAKPFVTHHNALNRDFFLRIAPELYLKRLVVGGLERVFELNRNFRNEGISTQHNPEFTMLEFYQAYATYEDLMKMTEELLESLCQKLFQKTTLTYQGQELSFKAPFSRMTLYQALVDIGGQKPAILESRNEAKKAAQKLGIKIPNEETPLPMILTEIFEATVESKLIQPTFIYNFPTVVSPLSRKNDKDPSIVDRFELFIMGREIANAFSELNDPLDQEGRFREQVQAKSLGDEEAMAFDADYIRALEYGMPPTAGEGIGIDRLVMILTDQPSIRDVILFPLLKTVD